MKYVNFLAYTLTAILFSQGLFAQNSVTAQVVAASGNGCPNGAGSVSVTLSPSFRELSILFDELRTEIAAGPLRRQVTSCRMNIEFITRGKIRLGFTGSELRGYALIPTGSKSAIMISHRNPSNTNVYTGSLSDINLNRQLNGPFDSEIYLVANATSRPIWSRCPFNNPGFGIAVPGKLNLEINLTINSENRNSVEDLLASVDSLDVNSNNLLKYNMQVGSCP